MMWLLICFIKKLDPIVPELFIRGRKTNISLTFIAQSYLFVPKKCYNELYAIFYYENSKQIRSLTSRI